MWTVMIVDDELPALDELSDVIAEEERVQDIHRFQTPSDAIAAYRSLLPDIVFLDIEMPGMSGLELAATLQNIKNHVEIVFVTAYSEHALAAFHLFALDYVLKPFEVTRIRQTFERFNKIRHPTEPTIEASTHSQTPTIHMFGPFEARGMQGPIQWNSSKSAELFAYLLLHRKVGLMQILDDVFPDSDMERGTLYTHTCLYRIRKSLQASGLDREITIQYRNKRYETVVSSPLMIDYERFLQTHDAAQRIALYRGDLLFEFDAVWVNRFQQSCLAMYLDALEEAMHAAQVGGDDKKILAYQALLQRFEA